MAWQLPPLNSITLSAMMIDFASTIHALAMGAVEDGAMPGEGLSAVETFTYFFAAPTMAFLLISVLVYALTGDRKRSKSESSLITSID